MWISKQNKLKNKTKTDLNVENNLVVARGGWLKWGKGIKRYKIPVIK